MRRLFRIYPAILVTSLLSIAMILTTGDGVAPVPASSAWFQGRMSAHDLTTANVLLSRLALRSIEQPGITAGQRLSWALGLDRRRA